MRANGCVSRGLIAQKSGGGVNAAALYLPMMCKSLCVVIVRILRSGFEPPATFFFFHALSLPFPAHLSFFLPSAAASLH